MALIKANLKLELSTFSDQEHPLFEGFPTNTQQNAEKWADAIDNYASLITPPSTSNVAAKTAFLNIMKGLSEPLEETSSLIPFTLYYKSPEQRLRWFNQYLVEKLNYKPNPILDKTATFTKLNQIRATYNKAFPSRELTEDDIRYNQSRFNEIYLSEINDEKVFKLKSDGVTLDLPPNSPEKYKHIPVNKDGVIIPLQIDGIIGDDTIRYWPIVNSGIYNFDNNAKWDNVYKNIPFVVTPKDGGEVDKATFPKNKANHYQRVFMFSNLEFKKNFIDTGKSKDYTTKILDRTQNTIDGGLGAEFFSEVPIYSKPISYFIQEYERRHLIHDKFWRDNGISTINQLVAYFLNKKITFNSKPAVQKDGITALENAITAYAQALAVGMAPTFTAAANVVPLSLRATALVGLNGGSNSDCINSICNLIDIWFRGGIATNNSSGATTIWS